MLASCFGKLPDLQGQDLSSSSPQAHLTSSSLQSSHRCHECLLLDLLTCTMTSYLTGACRSWAVSATQVVMCASPLSTIVKALAQKSSASFHFGLIVMNCLSSTMWTIYGITQQSLFISVPSALGIGLSLAALAVCIFFPRRYILRRA